MVRCAAWIFDVNIANLRLMRNRCEEVVVWRGVTPYQCAEEEGSYTSFKAVLPIPRIMRKSLVFMINNATLVAYLKKQVGMVYLRHAGWFRTGVGNLLSTEGCIVPFLRS